MEQNTRWLVRRVATSKIVGVVTDSGSHFFDRDTMRFFQSRAAQSGWEIVNPEGMTHGFTLVTSEPDIRGNDRRYTVRLFVLSGDGRMVTHTDDAAGFRGYGSRAEANRMARHLAVGLMNYNNDTCLTTGNSSECRDCGRSTAVGSGRFANRVPAVDDAGTHWVCVECAEAVTA